SCDRIKGFLIDDGVDEVSEVFRPPHLDGFEISKHQPLDFIPQVVRYIATGCCGTLLALELKCSSHDRSRKCSCICTLMSDDEVLTPGFSYDARIRPVLVNIFAYGLPHLLEHFRTPGEMQSGKIPMVEHNIANGRAICIDEIYYSFRQACLFQDTHDHLSCIYLSVGRFPHDGVAHQRHTCWE